MATATANTTQTARPLAVTTPLGKDVMLAVGFQGAEHLSKPYRFSVAVKVARATAVAFEKVVGHPAGVKLDLPKSVVRYFHGICARMEQGDTDTEYTTYHLDLVPRVWLLTKKTQSRIFQHLSVPAILKIVFAGFDVEYQIAGTFEPRNYCVQYRETDFDFACRLMEEEGIYYFFKFAADKHTMVLANTPQSHPAVPGEVKVPHRVGARESFRDEDFVTDLTKSQSQVTGKFLLWDHTFELPHQSLSANKGLTETVAVGKVTHTLTVGDYAKLEQYDWPGGYVPRFDGIGPGGAVRPTDLTHLQADNARTVGIRMQETAASAVRLHGAGTARQLAAGHKFGITTSAADLAAAAINADGDYVVTTVHHTAHLAANYRSGGSQAGFRYDNTFAAIPAALPYRPERLTPRPVVPGCQTAVVVGPAGEEIFTDKYGRIKVQFHWDREGKKNADSSCWIRVAHLSAGRAWGMVSIPRVGQEVIVDFLEGDPDRPICVGCVYNPDQMPMYKLPDEKTKSYIRTNSSPGGNGYNAIRFEDKAGSEQVYVHAQKDYDERVRHDSKERIGHDRHLRVGFELANDHTGDVSGESKTGSQFEEVAVNQHLKVHKNRDEQIGGDYKLLVGGGDGDGNTDIHIKGNKKELVDGTSDLVVKLAVTEDLKATYDLKVTGAATVKYADSFDETIDADRTEKVGTDYGLTVGGGQSTKVTGAVALDAGANYDVKAGASHSLNAGAGIYLKAGATAVIEASGGISLVCGGSFITVSPAGVMITGPLVMINSGGAALPGVPGVLKPPKAAKAPKAAATAATAKPTKPKDADHSKTGRKSN